MENWEIQCAGIFWASICSVPTPENRKWNRTGSNGSVLRETVGTVRTVNNRRNRPKTVPTVLRGTVRTVRTVKTLKIAKKPV
ncbi:hypothetical protein LguiB_003898 [Lonicera macranthoides]